MSEAMAPTRPSVEPDEIARFQAIAAEWWDPHGKFRPLHKFNPVRLEFIRTEVAAHFGRDEKSVRPFEGLRFLDIGCGGGLLAEPMSRLGADVVAVDAADRNIKTALVHAEEQGLAIDYRVGTAEEVAEAGECFDVVLNMEVIEHVTSPGEFVETCASLLKPGGLMVVATLNRTLKAAGLAIFGAEYVLRWLPRGTHQWSKFIKPEELEDYLAGGGLELIDTYGVSYNPLADRWSLSADTDVNYMMVAEKPKAA